MYLDLLALVNLGMNFFVLWMVSIITSRAISMKRLTVGAMIGTICVLVTIPYTFHPSVYGVLVITIATAMIFISFYPFKFTEFTYLLGVTLGVSFLVGGMINALPHLIGVGKTMFYFNGKWLIGSCFIIFLLVRYLRPYINYRHWSKIWWTVIEIRSGNNFSRISAFLDTGNRLKDPFSHKPVILVDYRSIKELIPEPIAHGLEKQGLGNFEAIEMISEHSDARRFFVIPFQSLKENREMLVGFRPDNITIICGEGQWELGDRVVLGLYHKTFGSTGEFQALLPPEVIGWNERSF